MITGIKTSLRAVELEDAETYYLWINDPETNLWRGLYYPTSLSEARSWIQNNQHTKDQLTLGVLDSEKKIIGFIGLRQICSRSRRAEIWIYIGDKTKWNQGYATNAMHILCNYAFQEMNLYRVWLECDPEHIPAIKCYEKIGFHKEGLLRKAYYRRGKFRDTCLMGLLRDEFKEVAS